MKLTKLKSTINNLSNHFSKRELLSHTPLVTPLSREYQKPIFGSEQRFRDFKKPIYNPGIDLNPQYVHKEKKVQGFKINNGSVKQEIRKKLKKRKIQQWGDQGDEKNLENISILTADTMNKELTPGPGAYYPSDFEHIPITKKATVPKSQRFKESKTDTRKQLNIQYDQIEYTLIN